MALLTIGQAAKAAGVSQGTIRNVVSGQFSAPYRGLWSAAATPEKGLARHFTDDDIRLLKFIRSLSAAGMLHADIAARARQPGALDDFAPEEEDTGEEEAPGEEMPRTAEQSAAMVVWGWGKMLQEQLAEARERETELNDRLIDAERRAAAAEAHAAALEAQLAERRRGFWSRLTGR